MIKYYFISDKKKNNHEIKFATTKDFKSLSCRVSCPVTIQHQLFLYENF
jgi:hypothetical protein